MKKKTVLYTRANEVVSDPKHSILNQKTRLEEYCKNNNIEPIDMYYDISSAKNFNRPNWRKMIGYIKKHKGEVDLVLFVTWDRFSRNFTEAVLAIEELKNYGVEAQAIEQSLKLEPLYWTTPEVGTYFKFSGRKVRTKKVKP